MDLYMDVGLISLFIVRAKYLGFGDDKKPLGINVSQLAEKCGMQQVTLYRILSDPDHNPTFDNLEKVMLGLDLPCMRLMLDKQGFYIMLELMHLNEENKDTILTVCRALRSTQE